MTRIVTWNMNGWGKGREHNQAWSFLLGVLDPDIALLQEAAIPDVASEYRSLFTPALPGKRFGSVILSRLGALELQWEDNSRGPALVANSTIPSLGHLSIACVHARIEKNVGTIRWLRQTFGAVRPLLQEPFILGGDLNTARQAHQAWPHKGHGDFWNDVATWGFHEPLPFDGREQQSYWAKWEQNKLPTLGNTLQDDHILLDAQTFDRLTACHVWDTKQVRQLSDHAPVVVDLAD